MRHLAYILSVAIALTGCSGGGGGSGSGGTSPVPWNAHYAATIGDLPSCSGDIVGRLYFVEDTNSFKVCKTSGWVTINIDGQDGTPGVSVSSVKTISSSPATDYCIGVTGEDCYFKGGQVTTFSDGSFMLQFRWTYSYVVAGDTDFDTATSTLFFPSTYTGVSAPISPLVSRAGGYKTSYLVYVKSNEATTVWADTNADGVITSGTDELLYSATLTTL